MVKKDQLEEIHQTTGESDLIIPPHLCFFKKFDLEFVTESHTINISISVKWTTSIYRLFKLIKAQQKEYVSSSVNIYFQDMELELDYFLDANINGENSPDKYLRKDLQAPGENETVSEDIETLKIPYFLPIYLSFLAEVETPKLEILTIGCKNFQLCRIYDTITPLPSSSISFETKKPILFINANESIFVTGFTVNGPVPNSTGFQAFNFHLKVYKMSCPEDAVYTNFKIQNQGENHYTIYLERPIFLDAEEFDLLKIEFCDRNLAKVMPLIEKRHSQLAKQISNMKIFDWKSQGAVYLVNSGMKYLGTDGVKFGVVGNELFTGVIYTKELL